jgi:hypothetical protein
VNHEHYQSRTKEKYIIVPFYYTFILSSCMRILRGSRTPPSWLQISYSHSPVVCVKHRIEMLEPCVTINDWEVTSVSTHERKNFMLTIEPFPRLRTKICDNQIGPMRITPNVRIQSFRPLLTFGRKLKGCMSNPVKQRLKLVKQVMIVIVLRTDRSLPCLGHQL